MNPIRWIQEKFGVATPCPLCGEPRRWKLHRPPLTSLYFEPYHELICVCCDEDRYSPSQMCDHRRRERERHRCRRCGEIH